VNINAKFFLATRVWLIADRQRVTNVKPGNFSHNDQFGDSTYLMIKLNVTLAFCMSVAHAILCACFFVIHISSAPDVNVFHRNAVFKAKINKLNAFWARCRSYDSLNAAKLTTANLHHYFKADVAIVPGSVNFSSNIIHLTFSAHSRYTSRLYFHPTDGLHFV
jgi:hypothetical protein